MLIGLPSAHDFSIQFDETRGEIVELGLDNVRRGLGNYIPDIQGVRIVLHTLGEFGDEDTEVRLELDEAAALAEALLELVRQQRSA